LPANSVLFEVERGLFLFLQPMLTSESMYSIPFMLIIFILGSGISGAVYLLMEGRNPFRDGVVESKAEELSPVTQNVPDSGPLDEDLRATIK